MPDIVHLDRVAAIVGAVIVIAASLVEVVATASGGEPNLARWLPGLVIGLVVAAFPRLTSD